MRQKARILKAVEEWKNLETDPGAVYDRTIVMDGSAISPMVTWGINPGMVLPVDETIPGPEAFLQEDDKKAQRAYEYMGLEPYKKSRTLQLSMSLSVHAPTRV